MGRVGGIVDGDRHHALVGDGGLRAMGGGDRLGELDSRDRDTDLADAGVVVEWGEGLAERLSDRHLDITLERDADSEMRTATWQWSGS